MQLAPQEQSGLGTGLKPRHITMISIAGVIGAGLFVGSKTAIAEAGPGVLLSYAFAGLLVVLVMRMLGEMATAHPDTGSFSTYADRALGRWAGFSVGWLYWWFWVLVIPVEATAAADILSSWIGAPQWVWALLVTLALTASNLTSVGNYGEFEFWFAGVKVVAIVGFIAVGLLAIFGVLPGSDISGTPGFSLTGDAGGFLPNGFSAVLAGILLTMFSFMGTEIVTIAAAESPDPQKGVRRAVNSVIGRIGVFYLGSIFVVVALVPWNSAALDADGSFQTTLQAIGIPGAATIMDVVILTAVASCLNSALYTASRMVFSLSRRGDAPVWLSHVSRRGVPYPAILASTVVGFLAVVGNYLLPEKIFEYLLATSGALALVIYAFIALSQVVVRRRLDEAGERPAVRMWLFPWLTYATIAFIAVVLVLMVVLPGQRVQLALSLVLTVVVVALGLRHQRRRGPAARPADEAAAHR
ncbi:amino acid permease-associated region [Kineococcus radiotolerans SRS30216 = ATCC BAA-149]|uniref:Amino acid permease-associated region n=2 Tax=Kineococcus radiotolerans TaxID=131568 RepID=A6W902_KINRD|nr:amino acid permease [Kineococcus radiotolerans]ABS03291.1 amino acid permease-associated region [Kineococcus radiotolerans SRS30216 = ATCC BAA-149]